jgi:hypothetical protein
MAEFGQKGLENFLAEIRNFLELGLIRKKLHEGYILSALKNY